MNIDGNHIFDEIRKEKKIIIDFDYLSEGLHKLWFAIKNKNIFDMKNNIFIYFVKNIKEEDKSLFSLIGRNNEYISALCIINIFHIDDYILSYLVHEVLSDLFSLVDIQYPYENHKCLYLKKTGENYKEWGNGLGEISPHSDDLYEDLDVRLLSLTVCRDRTKTPTGFFYAKDLVEILSNDELAQLMNIEADFISGKNVSIQKKKRKKILSYSNDYGFEFSFDFRVDSLSGERMIPVGENSYTLLHKIRSHIPKAEKNYSVAKTGTYLIIANKKVFHFRSDLKKSDEEVELVADGKDYNNTPRLLYRSKGTDRSMSFAL